MASGGAPDEPNDTCQCLGEHQDSACAHERLAVVYVRQSRPQQLIRHPESTRLQYGLVDWALALAGPKHRWW